jgi:hypothetical protein
MQCRRGIWRQRLVCCEITQAERSLRFPQGLSTLDLRSNLVQRLGWDWSEVQLGALAELRLEANPLDCVCPMPERMAARLLRSKEADRQQQTEKVSCSGMEWGCLCFVCIPKSIFILKN